MEGRKKFKRPLHQDVIKPWEAKKRKQDLRKETSIRSEYRKLVHPGSSRKTEQNTSGPTKNDGPENAENPTTSGDQGDSNRGAQKFGGRRAQRPGDKKGGSGKSMSYSKAKRIFDEKQKQKTERQQLFKQRDEERKVALERRKVKRLEKYKVITQKTSRGQPVMKGRIELLLKKIQEQVS